jgi:hypothetical protein
MLLVIIRSFYHFLSFGFPTVINKTVRFLISENNIKKLGQVERMNHDVIGTRERPDLPGEGTRVTMLNQAPRHEDA